MTTPISLVVDDDPPLYYIARVTPVYCCNCRETVEVTEPFTAHAVEGRTGVHMRPIKGHNSNMAYYNLPVRRERANPIPIPFCHSCASDTTFSSKPKAPPRKAPTPSVNPSWVGANKPSDYTIAGTLKAKEPKAAKQSKPKSYTIDDLD